MIWQRFPSIRILMYWVSAIILYPLLEINQFSALLSLGLSFTMALGLNLFPRINQKFGVFGFGFSIKISLFFFMWLILSLKDVKFNENHYSHLALEDSYYQLKINSSPKEKEKVFALEAELLSIYKLEKVVEGNMLLYFEKDSSTSLPQLGDQIIWKGKPNFIEGPKNPNEFNFKKYLQRTGLHAQAYLKNDSWFIYKTNNPVNLKSLSLEFRNHLLSIIDSWKAPEEVKNISKALLLGYKNELDQELRNSYANTGVAHILAVSGLHVGILYFLLSFVLKFLNKLRGGQWFRSFILLSVLWFYAFFTGLSPSVLRAVCMFSFLAFAGFFKRDVSIYNTLSASAIFLLLYNPLLLYNLGFQLSYLAVFSIVWLQKHLLALWSPKNWILKQIWSISTVSIAAQIGTSPIAIYYFHQFPSYFLLSNIIIIPLISIIMYCGLLLLILSSLGFPSLLLLKIYSFLVDMMNLSIREIEKFPGSIISSLHLELSELFLAYLILLLMIVWFLNGKIWKLKLGLFTFLLFLGLQIAEKHRISNSRGFVFFSLSKARAIAVQEGNTLFLIGDSRFWNDKKQYQYKVQPYLISQNIMELKKRNFDFDFCDSSAVNRGSLLSTNVGQFWQVHKTFLAPNADYWILETNISPPKRSRQLPKILFVNHRLKPAQFEKWGIWAKKNSITIWNLEQSAFYSNGVLRKANFSFL